MSLHTAGTRPLKRLAGRFHQGRDGMLDRADPALQVVQPLDVGASRVPGTKIWASTVSRSASSASITGK